MKKTAAKPTTKKTKTKPTIPVVFQEAVATFDQKRADYETFVGTNAKLMEQLFRLRNDYNDSLKRVKDVYREHYASIGLHHNEFSVSIVREVDPFLLCEIIGEARAIELKVLEYVPKVNRKIYNAALADETLPREAADAEQVKQVKILGRSEV